MAQQSYLPTQYGPIRLQAVGDTYVDSARICTVLWVGATTAGDEVIVECPETHRRLWHGRTPDTNTYLGVDFGDRGIPAPYGFVLTKHDAGGNANVYIYLAEA